MCWLLLQKFSAKQTRKVMYMSKFSCWRCPQCIHWRLLECCLLWLLRSHHMCHLGQSLPGPGPQRAASVYMLCLSTVLPVPLSHLFQSESLLHAQLPPLPSTEPAHPSPPTIPLPPQLPAHRALLHSRLPDPQNKSVGWGCTEQYPVNNDLVSNRDQYPGILLAHIKTLQYIMQW